MNCLKVLILLLSAFFCASAFNDMVEVAYEIVEWSTSRDQVSTITFFDATSNNSISENDFIDDLMSKIGSKHVVRRINLDVVRKWRYKNKLYSVMLLLNNMDEFRNFVKTLTDKVYNYHGYYNIMFKHATKKEVHEIFQTLWDYYIYNLNLIREINDSVTVETFIPFREGKCNKTDPVLIAAYKDGKFELKSDNFFPLKFHNFNKCPVKFTTYESPAVSVIPIYLPNGTLNLVGRDVETFRTLGHIFNFTLDMFYIAEYGGWGYYNQNGTMTGAMARAIRRETDFILGGNHLKYDRALAMSHSYGYYLESLIFLLPPSSELSSIHKLIRPFQNYVWMCMIAVIIVTILVIILLQFQSKAVRDFVYGTNIQSPCMNILTAIVGGCQEKLPRRNFARSMLMMFLLFCIVIRSIYQGSLYKFLQQNDLEPDPASVEEIAEKNLTFYILNSWDELTINNTFIISRRKIIDAGTMARMMNETLKSDFDGVVMHILNEVLYRNKLRSLRGLELLKVCKEFYTMIPSVMYFPKNSYLVDNFNLLLMRLESAGLQRFWQSNYGDMRYLQDPNEFTGPKSLRLSHLSAVFQIWVSACLTGFIIFIFELIFNESRVDKLRNMLGIKKKETVEKNAVKPHPKLILKSRSMRW